MKILEAKWVPNKKHGILHGNLSYNGSLHLLVDEIPDVKFKKIGNFFYGEKDGYVRLYEHKRGTTQGFAGRTITLDIEGVGEMDFHGCLWDPFECPKEIPKHFCIGITTEPGVMEKGYTFYSGKITWELAQKIINSIEADVAIRRLV